MRWGYRVNIAERRYHFVFINDIGGRLPGGDFTENTRWIHSIS
jgi:hypothetical protein